MGEKTKKHFFNIDSKYNAKAINQNSREYTTLSNALLFLLLSTAATKIVHLMSE
jgi:hypothetical protein